MKQNSFGYTLAEVLITLGVIGVVAALTLPVITSKIEKQVLRTQFMKQYRNITATRQELEAENGSVINCYLTYPHLLNEYSECESFWDNFFKKNKVIKTCNYGVEGCSPIYKSGSEVVNSGGVRNGTVPSLGDSPAKVYVLADGVLLYVPTQTWLMNKFFIDINGFKGPNKYGYDMFPMILHKNSSKLTDVPYPIFEKGGRRIKNMLLNNDDVNNSLFSE